MLSSGSACQKTGDREEKEEVKKSAKPVREKNVEKFAKEYKFVVTLGRWGAITQWLERRVVNREGFESMC